MNLLIKAENDWRDVGRPQVAMHRNCNLLKSTSVLFSTYVISVVCRCK